MVTKTFIAIHVDVKMFQPNRNSTASNSFCYITETIVFSQKMLLTYRKITTFNWSYVFVCSDHFSTVAFPYVFEQWKYLGVRVHVCFCMLAGRQFLIMGNFIAFKSSFSDLSEVIASDHAINHCPAILWGAVKRLRIGNTFISERGVDVSHS